MKPIQSQNLERVLQSAVVVSWAELVRGGQNGLVNIEYGLSPSGLLNHLQVWSSSRRGYWLLACSYWMSASESHDMGIHFDNGYQSEALGRILAVVMQHQQAFVLPPNLCRQGSLQITTPGEAERATAAVSVKEAIDSLGFGLGEILLVPC
jgi:hypothetical protein